MTDPITKETTPAADDENYCTLVFRCNLRRFNGSPHYLDTPFGVAKIAGIGNAFAMVDDLDAHATALEAENAKLRDVLKECEEYFDQRADAEYFTDSAAPVGNAEMSMLVMVRKALNGE